MPDRPGADRSGPDPTRIRDEGELVAALDVLRQRAARGSRRARLSLDGLAARSGIPRSTVHVYLTGRSRPTPDALDALLLALGVSGSELGRWSDALERLAPRTSRPPSVETSPSLETPRQLPPAPRGFVARQAELQRLDDVLLASADSGARLAAVFGPGGVGKSALALTWAHRRLEHFPDGQLWLDLRGFGSRPPLSAVEALGRLLRSLRIPDERLPAGADERADLFRSAVAGRRILLVLDNARSSAQVRPLLPGSPSCAVLVTSRTESRALAAETGAMRLRLAPLDDAASLTLLGDEVRAEDAKALARYCEGFPLALRIVRERLHGRPPSEPVRLRAELSQRRTRLGALSLDDGDGDGGIGIRSVLASSYQSLHPEQAAMLRVLPLSLGRDITLEAAAAAGGVEPSHARRTLDGLIGASLVEPAGPDRYRVNDLVAVYAEECRPAAETHDARDRLLRWLSARTYAASAALETARAIPLRMDVAPASFATADAATVWLQDSVELIVQVSEQALRAGCPDRVWPLLAHATQAQLYRGDLAPLRPVLHAAAAAAAERGRAEEEAVMYRAIGITAGVGGDFDAASAAFERVAELATRLTDPWYLDVALSNLALIANLTGRHREAIERHEKVRVICERAGLSTLHADNALTTSWCELGDLDRAVATAQRAVEHVDDAPTPPSTKAMAFANLAWVLLERGDPPEDALRIVRVGRSLVSTGAHANVLALCAFNEAEALRRLGRHDEAGHVLDVVEDGVVRSAPPEAVDLLLTRARLVEATDGVAAALAVREDALRLARETNIVYKQAIALEALGATLRRLRRPGDARTALDECLSVCLAHGFVRVAARCRTELIESAAACPSG